MISAGKIAIICSLFFAILSISINDRPVFDHIYTVTSQVTLPVQELTMSLFSKAATSTTAYSKKLFDNSVPRHRDSVKAKAAAPVRAKASIVASPQEEILNHEKEELDDLIKKHR